MIDWLKNKILPAIVMMLLLGVVNAYTDIKTLKIKAEKTDHLSDSVSKIKRMMCILTLEIAKDNKKLKKDICAPEI